MNKNQKAMVAMGAVLLVALVVVLINVYGQLGELTDGQEELGRKLETNYRELTEKLEEVGSDLGKLGGDVEKLGEELEATGGVLEERTRLFETALSEAEARREALERDLMKLEREYGEAWEQAQEKIDSLERDMAQVRSGLENLERRLAQAGGTAEEADFSIPMTYVQGGSFQMGSDSGYSDEKPVHTVTVDSFYMGTYEITQDIYEEVMGSNPSYRKGDQLPVENVSWYDAAAFCNALSRLEGRQEAYTISGTNVSVNWESSGYRLPTEAEWEYAARGGNQSRGYTYAGSNTVGDVAWYDDNSGGRTHPVGEKQANELGLYDMSGNVWEWCWDWYGSYSGGVQTNPTGPSSGSTRVLRGGRWYDSARYVRAANRSRYAPSDRGSNIGFRVLAPAR
jgi:formylglycine-generating enzyme